MKATANAILMLLLSHSVALSKPLPLKDGTYVTDQSLCPLSAEQRVHRYGDAIGMMVWNIHGSKIDNEYETYCVVKEVSVSKKGLRARVDCSSEGESSSSNLTWAALTDDSFKDDGRIYKACATPKEAGGTNVGTEFILDQLRCVAAPNPAPALQYLVAESVITPSNGQRFDSLTCWSADKPFDLNGLAVSSVCAADESPLMQKLHPDLFWRGPGTSAGTFLSVGTKEPPADVKHWMVANGVSMTALNSVPLGDAVLEMTCAQSIR